MCISSDFSTIWSIDGGLGGGVIPNIRYGVANSGHRPIRCSILEFKDQQGVESTKVFLNFIQ